MGVTWLSHSTRGFAGLLVGAVLLVVPAAVLAASVPYASCFARSAVNHSVPASLLQAVAATESNFNPSARSHANAHGVMQIQWPGTAKHLGVKRVAQLYSPCKNIDWGARYLRELLDKYDNNERRALAAYNYGPGRITAEGVLPAGALKYVATVNRHRSKLTGRPVRDSHAPSGSTSERQKGPAIKRGSAKQLIASFSSRSRARRYRGLLESKLPDAQFSVGPARFRRHAVFLTSDSRRLSADQRTLLTSLGWKEPHL